MKQRGRKSVSGMGVVAPFDRKRPEPPGSLSEEQAATWHGIVSCLPVDWFNGASLPLLEAYVRHIAVAGVIDRQIDQFKPEWLKEDDGLTRYKKLLDMRANQSSVLLALARSMRLTNQSRYTPQRAGTEAANVTTGRKPWE